MGAVSGMVYLGVFGLCRAADVVQEAGGDQNIRIDVFFKPGDIQCGIQHSLYVRYVVRTARFGI